MGYRMFSTEKKEMATYSFRRFTVPSTMFNDVIAILRKVTACRRILLKISMTNDQVADTNSIKNVDVIENRN